MHGMVPQARMFRSAVVAGGAVPELVAILSSEESQRQLLAARALHALALDDPTTEADNFHQLEICQFGAVEPLVALLKSENAHVQQAATGALAALAENPTCQQVDTCTEGFACMPSASVYGREREVAEKWKRRSDGCEYGRACLYLPLPTAPHMRTTPAAC